MVHRGNGFGSTDCPEEPACRLLKVKNPDYSQAEGRYELFSKRR